MRPAAAETRNQTAGLRNVRTGEGDQHGRDVHLRQPLMQKHDRNDRDCEHGDAVHDADIRLKRVSRRVEQQHDGKQSEERTREHLRPVFALTEERLVVLDEDEACHEDADQVAEKRLLPQGYLRRVQSHAKIIIKEKDSVDSRARITPLVRCVSLIFSCAMFWGLLIKRAEIQYSAVLRHSQLCNIINILLLKM